MAQIPCLSMVRRRSVGLALVLWLLAASLVQAAADPLSVIPSDALGVVVINNLADTSARIQKLTEKMQIPVPELLPMAQLYTGAQQGLDDQGSLAAAIFPGDDELSSWSSMVAVFVPVTDYKAFIDQLQPDDAGDEMSAVTIFGMQFLAMQKGEFAVLASGDAKDLLVKIKAASKGIADTVTPMRPWIGAQQLAAVATPEGKTRLVKAISGFLDVAVQGIQDAAADTDDDEEAKQAAEALRSATETMKVAKELVALIDEQVTQLGLGVRIDETTALHLSTRAMFVSEGGLSKWAASVKRPESGLLKGLPAGKFTLAYGGASVQSAETITKMYDRMTQAGMIMLGLDEENQKQLNDVLAKYRQNQISTAALMGQPRPGDSIMSTSMQVEHVRDAALQLQLAREMFAVFSKVRFPGGDPDRQAYSVADVTVGDLKAVDVTMDMGAMLGGANQAEAAGALGGILQKLFGNDGVMHSYITVADDHTLVMAYSKEQLQYAVKHVRSGDAGLETDESIANTDKLLPAAPQWAAYLSPQGIVQWVDMFLKQVPELNFNLPPFPASDPIGLAAKVSAEGLDAEIVLPESVVAGVGQYIGVIQQMIMQGGAPLP